MVARADPIVMDVIADHLIERQRPRPPQLSAAEQDAVLAAARPLTPAQREAFLVDVAVVLSRLPGPIGPGSLHHVLAMVQARHFVPPAYTATEELRHKRTVAAAARSRCVRGGGFPAASRGAKTGPA